MAHFMHYRIKLKCTHETHCIFDNPCPIFSLCAVCFLTKLIIRCKDGTANGKCRTKSVQGLLTVFVSECDGQKRSAKVCRKRCKQYAGKSPVPGYSTKGKKGKRHSQSFLFHEGIKTAATRKED